MARGFTHGRLIGQHADDGRARQRIHRRKQPSAQRGPEC